MAMAIEREFWLRTLEGDRKSVWLRIELNSEERPEGGGASCRSEIGSIDDEDPRCSVHEGPDAVFVLYSAMMSASVSLMRTTAYRSGRLSYKGVAELGLPMFPMLALQEKRSTWVLVDAESVERDPALVAQLQALLAKHLVAIGEEEFSRLKMLQGGWLFAVASIELARQIMSDVRALGVEVDVTSSPGEYRSDSFFR